MTVDLASLPDPSTLPIPDDVRPNRLWSPLMIEIADHIGARRTLELVARFGGQRIRVPVSANRSPFRDVIGAEAAARLSDVFGREQIDLPTARPALTHARRQGVIARARAGELNLSQAARMLRTSRSYIGKLVNRPDEGLDDAPASRHRDSRQIELFDETPLG